MTLHVLGAEYGQRPSTFAEFDDLDADERRAIDLASFEAFKTAEADAVAIEESRDEAKRQLDKLMGR